MLFREEPTNDLRLRGNLTSELGLAHPKVDPRLVEHPNEPVDGADLSGRPAIAGGELLVLHLRIDERVERSLLSSGHPGCSPKKGNTYVTFRHGPNGTPTKTVTFF